MTAEKRAAIRAFVEKWQGKGDEKQETQRFWMALLQDIYDVADPSQYIEFEKTVQLGHQSYIDGYIPSTKVLIEQKGKDIDLSKGQKQSDGTPLTPYGQAKRYNSELPKDEQADWIIVSNFTEFRIYNTNRPNDEPSIVFLKELENDYARMNFLVDQEDTQTKKEEKVSSDAGKIVGELYDALLKQYKDPENPETLQHLNKLCVRIVFLLYAEDAGVFSEHNMFHKYLKSHALHDVRRALMDLFETLNTPKVDRDEYIDETLNKFPYVNGGLFAEKIVIPRLDEHIVELILQKASADFDWSEINPTIFGAVFESTLNPETRRKGGMHYTSIENIHKVIDPLFLDGLYAEFEKTLEEDNQKKRNRQLEILQDKLANLTFLDPACGSGNFLTETYLSLRRLENMILRERTRQIAFFEADEYSKNPIKVSIGQFYGIEINDFAVTVANAALWIADIQMRQETEDIIFSNTHTDPDLKFFPLHNFNTIVEGNALQMNWEEVVSNDKLNYIIGNPPFVGYSLQSKEQKKDITDLYVDENKKPYKDSGKIDYVAGWYFKAAEYMKDTAISTAFVSTNSITQGEQVAGVWQPLYNRFNIHIDFAHCTFQWDSETSEKAQVYCVIIGFSTQQTTKDRVLYLDEKDKIKVKNINFYLVAAENIFITKRTAPLADVPQLLNGGKPTEGGHLILSLEEKDKLIKNNPSAAQFIRPYMMGRDFIERKPRYCLWLVNANPAQLINQSDILDRIKKVREYRLESKKAATRKKADTPMLFDEVRECTSTYIAIPKVSSGKRKYIPMDYLSPDIIPGDKLFMLPDSTLYHFGILTSNIHMAWMRAVCSRLGTSYSYSNTIGYNNFPWPTPTPEQKALIEQTAQMILDARAKYPDASLADLYGDDMILFPELYTAHIRNDQAVAMAYGIDPKTPEYKSESACVAMLMRMYQALTEKEPK